MRPTEHSVGDRVVVVWKRKELAGTVSLVGRVGYVVTTDETFEPGTDTLFRYEHDVFDAFNDGSTP